MKKTGGQLVYEGVLSRRRGPTKEVSFVAEPKPKERTRPLRVARMLALAHECEVLIAAGVVTDRAELAKVLGFTRARVTQLLDLTLLAPDIQEALLVAEVEPGWDPVTERALRRLVARACWAEQRASWRELASLSARAALPRRIGAIGPYGSYGSWSLRGPIATDS